MQRQHERMGGEKMGEEKLNKLVRFQLRHEYPVLWRLKQAHEPTNSMKIVVLITIVR